MRRFRRSLYQRGDLIIRQCRVRRDAGNLETRRRRAEMRIEPAPGRGQQINRCVLAERRAALLDRLRKSALVGPLLLAPEATVA